MNKKIYIAIIAILFVVFIICIKMCTTPPTTTPPTHEEDLTLPTDTLKSPQIKIFIENSGSMDGFLEGTTSFKEDVYALLGDLDGDFRKDFDSAGVRLFLIRNDKAIKKEDEQLNVIQIKDCNDKITDYANAIDLEWKKDKESKNRGSNTLLNNIFSRILDSTDFNTLSVLISDCVYSMAEGDVVNALNSHKGVTSNVFRDAIQKFAKTKNSNLITTVLKMKSVFNGEYFPYTGDQYHFKVQGDTLSYYICFITANPTISKHLNNYLSTYISYFKGFDNKLVLSHDFFDDINYSVLGQSDKLKGGCTYKFTKDYHGIKSVSQKKGKKLEIAVAVDLSKIDLEQEYLLNADNYISDDDEFVVKDVYNLKDKKEVIYAKEWDRIKNNTHLIVLQATKDKLTLPKKSDDVRKVKIALKKQVPSWIEDCNIMDDTDREKLKGGKSFALKYWIEGITEAYQKEFTDDTKYFEIEININK